MPEPSEPFPASFVLRPFHPDDAQAFLEVHHAAVRGTAADSYGSAILDAWAPSIEPVQIGQVRADRTNRRIVATLQSEIVGIGEVVPEICELRACYVLPAHGGNGIGAAIVSRLEQIARSGGARSLWLDASLNAEGFYAALGYGAREYGAHRLGNGVKMPCVRMTKQF